MNRRVNRSLIDQYVKTNKPGGLNKLETKSDVCAGVWARARIGRVPAKPITRKLMCRALGVPEDELFPLLTDGGEGKAS